MAVGVVLRDDGSAEFFDAAARGQLVIRRCAGCGQLDEPGAQVCSGCGSSELTWAPSAGAGTVVARSVVTERRPEGELAARTVVAIVELDEGPWLYAQVVDVAPDEAAIGQSVRVDFERPDGGEAVPVFRLG